MKTVEERAALLQKKHRNLILAESELERASVCHDIDLATAFGVRATAYATLALYYQKESQT